MKNTMNHTMISQIRLKNQTQNTTEHTMEHNEPAKMMNILNRMMGQKNYGKKIVKKLHSMSEKMTTQ